MTATTWRNRIVGHADMPPDQLVAHPANWRLHRREQQEALAGALSEIGWVAQVLVNRTTGHVVDGAVYLATAFRDSRRNRWPSVIAGGADRGGAGPASRLGHRPGRRG